MKDLPADRYSLVADIGGTNTRVALAEGKRLVAGSIKRYRNADHSDLESVLNLYLAAMGGVDCAGACVAVAGPVRDGVGSMTNLDWTIDTRTLARATRAETVAILNDLQAQSYALAFLEPSKTPCVLDAPAAVTAATNAPRLVIGIGTGFNAAPIHETANGTRYSAPSECGHASLPVITDHEIALARHIEAEQGFCAVEDVLSGRGLERVYGFLSRDADATAPALMAADIMQAAAADATGTARRAVGLFVSMLGRVAGDLALIHLPYGGVYLVGGVARAVTPYLASCGFAEGFRDKGRFSAFMQNFPVSVIEDDYAALLGCAAFLEECD
ncbi:glucokinase [Brevirhabdus sp.]|uniref:glucokinase n=1 Tax=Brevirhabdus sp. TaxID=2004514 RepID=UPI004058B14F